MEKEERPRQRQRDRPASGWFRRPRRNTRRRSAQNVSAHVCASNCDLCFPLLFRVSKVNYDKRRRTKNGSKAHLVIAILRVKDAGHHVDLRGESRGAVDGVRLRARGRQRRLRFRDVPQRVVHLSADQQPIASRDRFPTAALCWDIPETPGDGSRPGGACRRGASPHAGGTRGARGPARSPCGSVEAMPVSAPAAHEEQQRR